MSSGTQKESSDNPTLFFVALVNHISESSHTFSHSSSLTVCHLYLPVSSLRNVYRTCNSLRSPQMKTPYRSFVLFLQLLHRSAR